MEGAMSGRQRIRVALGGEKADRVPILPIYDNGYLYTSVGEDLREWPVQGGRARAAAIERNFRRHEVDGLFVYEGTDESWPAAHEVERRPDYWLVTEKATGRRRRLYPNGAWADESGASLSTGSVSGPSRIESDRDIERAVPRPATPAEIEGSGFLAPLRLLRKTHPGFFYTFPVLSPMVNARFRCGGFVEMLVTLGTDAGLFRALLERETEYLAGYIAPARDAGADAMWFGSYFTGADTISPRTYAETVFPFEYRLCRAAREAGLRVILWFLGDLLPILDKVMELPIDALALEQGRKGYSLDPVEIRRRVGPRFCLVGWTVEKDLVDFRRDLITAETRRQVEGAGLDGAFIAGTTIVSPDTPPAAVDYYFSEVRRLGKY